MKKKLTVKASMQSRDDFDDDDDLIAYLARQLVNGRLALVLGAGLSVPFGLPDWPSLLKKLYSMRRSRPPKGLSLTRQAEDYRNHYFKSDRAGFIQAVHDGLYDKMSVDFDLLRQNATLGAIGALVMASRRGSVSEVITFNWDDLLELYLGYHGFAVRHVFEETHWNSRSDVTILHPHGFIPYDLASQPSSSDLVFDQMSYSEVCGDDKRPWRQRMLSTMRTHSCLFIGLSGEDANLDSLLCACGPQHAAIKENTVFWGVRFTTSRSRAEQRSWERRGVYCKRVANYESGLPEFLFAICQRAAGVVGT